MPMTKDEIIRKYKQYLFPSVSTYFAEPLVTDHASMQYLWDADGKKYLDFFGGIVTISAGHTNPRITSKIKARNWHSPLPARIRGVSRCPEASASCMP